MYGNKVLESAAVRKTVKPELARKFTIVGLTHDPQVVEVELTGDIVDGLNWCIEVDADTDIPVGFGVADSDLYDDRIEAAKALCQESYKSSFKVAMSLQSAVDSLKFNKTSSTKPLHRNSAEDRR